MILRKSRNLEIEFRPNSKQNNAIYELRDIIFLFSNAEAVTEMWESESGSLQTQQPVLERGQMSYGIGMWLVDKGYCAKNNKNS